MIATIIHIAKGSESIEYIEELLSKKSRKYAPPTFMPNGLYLTNIKYDDKWKFPILNNKVNILSFKDD
jgi:tRNA pseudouridine38-40 synthase